MSESAGVEQRVVLPFAMIVGKGGTEELPRELTYATILADMEKQRVKAGFIRKKEERLGFISTLYWPIITIPWQEGRNLVFDGMAVWSYVFEIGHLPSNDIFVKGLEKCRDYRDFISFEASNASYFKEYAEVESLPVLGLFIHEEFMKDLLAHIALARPKEVTDAAFLEPRLSSVEALASIDKLAKHISRGNEQLNSMYTAQKAVEIAVEKYKSEISSLLEDTKKKYNDRIEAIKPDVIEKVSRLEKRRDETWQSMQPRLLTLKGEQRKLESEERHWQLESKRKDATPDVTSSARARLKSTRVALKTAKLNVQQYQQEMSNVRADFDNQMQAQWERIRTLERERDAQLKRLLDDQKTMDDRARQIIQDMTNLKRKKEAEISFIQSQGVQIPTHVSADVMYLPVMVCSLYGRKKMRFIIYPPMIMKSGKGVLGGIQSMLGGIVLPLEPKTKQFDEVFRTGVEDALVEDTSLSSYINSKGMSANILHRKDLPGMLAKGLTEMKKQGWIKDKHEKELLQSLQKHISVAASTAPQR